MKERDFTFRKEDRLPSGKQLDELFKQGKSFTVFPFKVIWMQYASEKKVPAQLLITVPKRNYKKAVDRNLLKRRIREAYRLNKSLLLSGVSEKKSSLILGLVYIAPKALSFADIQEKIILILQRLTGENEKITG
jgi:ribonuclease P protein component